MKKTPQLLVVAQALLANATGRHWGYDLQKATGLRSGVLYPILARMFDAGWLRDGWEDQASALGRRRPPRRYYEITDIGLQELGALPAPAAVMKVRVARRLGTAGA